VQARGDSRWVKAAWLLGGVLLLVAAVTFSRGSARTQPSAALARADTDREVTSLLAGIPQHGNTLGSPTAPITLQVYGDLECVVVKAWFLDGELTSVIKDFVRTDVVKIEYRAMKTDTLNPRVFVIQQTAALAAGAQDRMWNFLETFYHEQGPEYTRYVTEGYLDGIAQQVPGLNLEQWDSDRDLARAKSVIADDRAAHVLRLHSTPAFLIGRSGGPLRIFMGRHLIYYLKWKFRKAPDGELIAPERAIGWAHPLSLVDNVDVKKAVEKEI
jgi:protein-disulfide isomerase